MRFSEEVFCYDCDGKVDITSPEVINHAGKYRHRKCYITAVVEADRLKTQTIKALTEGNVSKLPITIRRGD